MLHRKGSTRTCCATTRQGTCPTLVFVQRDILVGRDTELPGDVSKPPLQLVFLLLLAIVRSAEPSACSLAANNLPDIAGLRWVSDTPYALVLSHGLPRSFYSELKFLGVEDSAQCLVVEQVLTLDV